MRAVLAIGIVTFALTGFAYWLRIGLDPSTHFGAIFASWVSGVALFAISGVAIAVITLARPELEPFDTRARILFRRQTGKHIDYIVGRIKDILEHYAEETEQKITIRDFHVGEKKFWVSTYSRILVRSYIDDVETTYVSSIARREITAPPQGGLSNRLVFARVDGVPVGASEDFTDELERPINCRIDRDGVCEVTSQVDFWIQAESEENKHRPKRYTQVLKFQFENLISPGRPVDVLFTTNGTDWLPVRLEPGQVKQVVEITDVNPGMVAFNFRLRAS
ncbi:hypothetical protein XI06_22260 [Bradyrhizobium sp. CCBAU 11434]|nr:hypothetical protein [Bradyrhizobium sp. CCBAU 21359]MDA9522926.1 hypothetical protein [Bradyrhizobium sp. CCBAU 11434]